MTKDAKKYAEKITELCATLTKVWNSTPADNKQTLTKLLEDFAKLPWGMLVWAADGQSLFATIHHNFAHEIFPATRIADIKAEGLQAELIKYQLRDIRRDIAQNILCSVDAFANSLLPGTDADQFQEYCSAHDINSFEVMKHISGILQYAFDYYSGDNDKHNFQVVNIVAYHAEHLEKLGMPIRDSWVRCIHALTCLSTAGMYQIGRHTELEMLELRKSSIEKLYTQAIEKAQAENDQKHIDAYRQRLEKIRQGVVAYEAGLQAREFSDRAEILQLYGGTGC